MSALAALTRLGESFSNRPPNLPAIQQDALQTEALLTSWPDEVRGVPNITLRSALFGSSRSSSQTYLQRAEIYAQRPTRMRYT